ncbi:MAG: hypothetical protein CVT64_06780 [Actinobacteria bacterium HGW-Actinobacteria-4]|nr:MAG: hypothetical protein CVT64_06780 [Actinobacteria bacterium HGW-Actinobacteria-4]
MGEQKSITTLLVTLLLVAVIGVASWLFYFSPTLEAIAATRAATVAQNDFNETFKKQVDALAADYARLPEIIDEINLVAEDLPPVEDVPNFIRTVSSLMDKYGLLIQELDISRPTVIDNSITLEAAAALYGQESYVEQLEFSGLLGTKFELTFIGPRLETFMLVDELQTGDHRYFLVEAFLFESLEPAGAEGVRPAIGVNWVETTITGFYFTLVQPDIDANIKPGEFGQPPQVSIKIDEVTEDA